MNFIKNKLSIWAIGVFLLVPAIVIFSLFINGKEHDLYRVGLDDFKENLIVAGKVIPAQEVDLSSEVNARVVMADFEIGEAVSAGDTLIVLDDTDIINEISEAQAALESQQSKLTEVKNQESVSSQNKLQNKKTELINLFKKTYTISDDIIKNKVDTFFENPKGRFPDFSKSLSNYFLREDINDKRYEVGIILDNWINFNNNLSIENIDTKDADNILQNLREIESLLKLISTGSVDFQPISTINQGQIDAYIANISSARNAVSNLILEVNQMSESLRQITAEIPVLEANVKQSEARLKRLRDNLSKYQITAPFNGVITNKNIEVGEISQIGTDLVSVISKSLLEIETFIPEIKINGIEIGNEGSAIFDAFSADKSFPVRVTHIDPRETEKDNIVTYRTLLDFVEVPNGIRPGMTVEVNIIKKSVENVLLIPKHLLQVNDFGYYVIKPDGEEIKVIVGPDDGKGNVIINKGLDEGDEIIVPDIK